MIKNDQQDLLYCSNEDEFIFYENGDGLSTHKSVYEQSFTKFHTYPPALDFQWVYSENDALKNDFENTKNHFGNSVAFQDFIDYEESSSSEFLVDEIFDFGLSSSPGSSTSDEWIENTSCVPRLSDKLDSALTVLTSKEMLSSLPLKEEYIVPEYVFIKVSSPVSEDSISEDDFSSNTSILISELLGLDQTPLPNKATNFNVINSSFINKSVIHPEETLKSSSLDDSRASKKLFSENVQSGCNDSYFNANCDSNQSLWQHESNYGKVKKTPLKKSLKTTEQKLRKKVQNRKAASRYRDKRKYELDDIFNGVTDLENQNNDLKGKVSSLQNEIDYLKNLMLDVIQARLSKKVC